MKEILFDKIGIARAGECKGWNVTIEKERDEHGDEYYVYLQNPKTMKYLMTIMTILSF